MKSLTTVNNINFKELVFLSNAEPVTDSLMVAKAFGKRHDNVIRSLNALECSSEFRALNFEETSQTVQMPNGGSKTTPMYKMTKDGFIFLVMGFTGKKRPLSRRLISMPSTGCIAS